MKTGKPRFEFYLHDGAAAFRMELAGSLNRETSAEAALAWRTASSTFGERRRLVDVTRLATVDGDGGTLLLDWHRDGVEIVANTKASRTLAESVIGEPLSKPQSSGPKWLRGWRTWRNPFATHAVKFLLVAVAFVLPMQSHAATLKPETSAAWDKYLASVEHEQQTRANPSGHFLRVFDDPKRLAAVQRGEIVAMPAPGSSPRRVPGGLIHHWIGAMFLPGVKLDEVLDVSSDIAHYKVIFKPYVIDSKITERRGDGDRFTIRLMN